MIDELKRRTRVSIQDTPVYLCHALAVACRTTKWLIENIPMNFVRVGMRILLDYLSPLLPQGFYRVREVE